MILLDTNVISEIFRVQPNPAVVAWIDSQSPEIMFLCTPVLAELCFGVAALPQGRRRQRFEDSISRLQHELFRGRMLVFDAAAAVEYGRIAAQRQSIGRRMGRLDAMIAAIASVHSATLATRNVGDFSDLDIEVINPFEGSAA
jgi:toxin FitB